MRNGLLHLTALWVLQALKPGLGSDLIPQYEPKPTSIKEYLPGELLPRVTAKRTGSGSGGTSAQGQNKRASPAQSLSQNSAGRPQGQVSATAESPRLPSRPAVSASSHLEPVQSLNRDTRSHSPSRSSDRQRDNRRSPAGSIQSQNAGLLHSQHRERSQSSSATQSRESSRSPSRASNQSSHQRSDSSDASSVKQKNPATVFSSLTGPATVRVYRGREEYGDIFRVKPGLTFNLATSHPKSAEMDVTLHGADAKAITKAKGRRVRTAVPFRDQDRLGTSMSGGSASNREPLPAGNHLDDWIVSSSSRRTETPMTLKSNMKGQSNISIKASNPQEGLSDVS